MDGRETYSRLELLSLADNVIDEIKLWYNKDKKSALLGAGIGFVIGIIYSVLGGLYGYFYESYLFLSCSGPAILYFFMPQIKDSLYNITYLNWINKSYLTGLFILQNTSLQNNMK